MEEENCGEAILGALLSLNSTQFSNLLCTLASDSLFQLQRLRALLLSPLRFLRNLRYIDSLSLPQKTHLIARFLLRSLQRITHHLSDDHTRHALPRGTLSGFQDYDAGLLLYTLCQLSDSERLRLAESSDWWATVADHVAREALRFSGLGPIGWEVLSPHVDAAMKCRRFIEAAGGWREKGEGRAAASAVVSIGAAVLSGGRADWRECVICNEELTEACSLPCSLPCSHVFHRVCIARWLTKNNTCPYCRLELPTDDVFCEIQRLWKLIVVRSRLDLHEDCISKRV